MIRRRLARPRGAYYDDPSPLLTSPEALLIALPLEGVSEVQTSMLFVRSEILNAIDGSRQVSFRPWPNLTLCTGLRAYRPVWLEHVAVIFSWSDYLKILKRRKSLPPVLHTELIALGPWETTPKGKQTVAVYRPFK